MRRIVSGAAALLAVTSAIAAERAQRYGETLIAAVRARHPDVAEIAIDAPAKDGTLIAIGDDFARVGFRVPLANAMGEPVGILSIRLRGGGEHGIEVARAIAREMARSIYFADNLAEPDPFVAGAGRAMAAQRMIDAAIAADPRLVTLAMHVTLPGSEENQIIASNFGRIGKAGDKDDQHVIDAAAPIREVTDAGKRLAVELPMRDSAGHVIGALSTSYSIGCGLGADDAFARAVRLRDDLADITPSASSLTQR